MVDFPLGSYGMTLKKMAECGMDMSQSVLFEFYIHVENKQQADGIYKVLQKETNWR